MNTREAFHVRCQRQILDVCWWVHVSNAKVLQRSGLSTTGTLTSSTLISVWPYCTPGPWSTSTWCSASDGGYLRRQQGQLEKTAGSPSQCMAQQSLGGCQRSTLWRAEIARGHGVERRSLGLCDDDDDGDDDDEGWLVSKMEGKTNFQGSCRLSGTRIVECLKSLT